MNLAVRDVRYRPGRFVLTALGLGLLLATVMSMSGIYRGLIDDALSLVRAAGADLWVVHYRAMTALEQETVLAGSVIERARQQLLLFRLILLVVSTVVIALVVYTLTLEKTRDIATLKTLGAPDWKIGALVLQESLGLGLGGYALGVVLLTFAADSFPRRVIVEAADQAVLLGVVVLMCVLASALGIRRALAVDPTTALGEGA